MRNNKKLDDKGELEKDDSIYQQEIPFWNVVRILIYGLGFVFCRNDIIKR